LFIHSGAHGALCNCVASLQGVSRQSFLGRVEDGSRFIETKVGDRVPSEVEEGHTLEMVLPVVGKSHPPGAGASLKPVDGGI
jgi:hypothetical protein